MIAAIAFSWALLASPPEELRQRIIERMEELYGVQRLDAPPPEARDLGEPLATFGIVADVHWCEGRPFDYVERSARFLNDRAPAVVFFLGDTDWTATPQGMRQTHERFRERIENVLEVPFLMVKGDNDARDHEAVWGSAEWALDLAGVRFVAIGLTRDIEGRGFGLYDQLDWLEERLPEDRPAVLLTHVPSQPSSICAGNTDLLALFRRTNSLAAHIAGHLHLDLQWTATHPPTYAVAALGVADGAPLKIGRIRETGILLETFRAEGDGYVHDGKWQWIAFPNGLRARAGGGMETLERGEERPTRFLTPDELRRAVRERRRAN
jgi:predicted phosphodiesterase